MRLVTIVALTALLSGCESFGGSRDEESVEPQIEDRGLSDEEMADFESGEAARSSGIDDGGGFPG
ncbi:MAG: hypothetical protein HKO62_11115, partial [Gammaproteobacteria bacterium]|nr:hypothetical protein [Gammaproteobacteria bacterium]